MSLLPEIIKWSEERPLWQRDALRRLVEQPCLSSVDHTELVALCKSEFGISVAGTYPAKPLTASIGGVVPAGSAPAVRLTRVHSAQHVNALRDGQTLVVAPTGLTVVYGDNGAGKSGYVRILKQVCRARGAKDVVHSNVYAEETQPASAVVCFEVVTTDASGGGNPPNGTSVDGEGEREAVWVRGSTGPAELAQVSIFDSRSASVYVTEQNDVAYLPHGTDLFPKLVEVVGVVKSMLEQEIAALDRARDRFDTISAGTQVADVLDNLHAANARKHVDVLAALSDAERAQLEELRHADRRYKAEDPLGRAKELRRCAARLSAVRERLAALETALDHSAVRDLREAREALSTANAAAELASGGAFADAPLGGVGSDTWSILWTAARRFAQDGAVPSQVFPPGLSGEAICVLCQQVLSGDARERMHRFEEFVRGETRAAVDRATRELNERITALRTLAPHTLADDVLLAEIASLDEELAALLKDCASQIARRRDELIKAAQGAAQPDGWTALAHEPSGGSERLIALEERVSVDAGRLEAAADPDGRKAVEDALRELEARAMLDGLRERVYAEIERQTLKAKLRKCVASANTAPITKRNTEVLRDAVSQPLADEFARQIVALDLTHLPIQIAASHGQKGKAYHGLALGTKPTKAKVPTNEVLSEGEHRCTALAAFFAEVSLQESASTVVFDDPVSSLDHGRRKYVAQRLVDIARTRPVLVFTHDLVFLWMLQGAAGKCSVGLAPRYFRRDESGAGLITEDWPWDGQNVKTRIGALKNALAALPKLAATNRPLYEQEARIFYGRLRETWERAVEEVLFNGAVRRFSPEVQTLRLRNLYRITQQQMQEFEAGMTKSSAWIQGHDHAAELALSLPEPPELAADLAALERWVAEVRAQHEAKKG